MDFKLYLLAMSIVTSQQACKKRTSNPEAIFEAPLPDVNYNKTAHETFELESSILAEAVSTNSLHEALQQAKKKSKTLELNILVQEDWREKLPLKLRNGDIRKANEGATEREIVGLGDVPIESLATSENLSQLLKSFIKDKLRRKSSFDVIMVKVQIESIQQLIETINSLNKLPGIIFSEPNVQISKGSLPNDPRYPELWALAALQAQAGWKNQTGTGQKVVAVLDTGIDANHPDLQPNLWTNQNEIAGNGIDDDRNGFIDDTNGWDFVDNNNQPQDENGHGTLVAGTIAAKGNNAIGITGVNWNGKIMPVRILDSNGTTYWNTAFSGFVYAIANGAHILSSSFASKSSSVLAASAMQMAHSAGKLVIAAAGNYGESKAFFPAYLSNIFPNVISVASTDQDGSISDFSNHGDGVDIAAPGRNILSTSRNNSYESFSGTSAAVPHVSGSVSLIWDSFPEKTHLEIKSALLEGADFSKKLEGKVSQARQLNLANAFKQLAGTASPRGKTPPIAVNGIRYRYYEGNWNMLPDFKTLTPSSVGTSPSLSLKPALRNNDFALIFEASLKVDKPGKYTFYLTSDDGSKLQINDEVIINNDGIHTLKEKQASVDLKAGFQKFRLEYFQSRKAKQVMLEWKGPKFKRENLSKSKSLYYFLE